MNTQETARSSPADGVGPLGADLPHGPPTWLYGLLLLAIVACTLVLRFSGLGDPALWHDEMIAVDKATLGLEAAWHEWILGLDWDVENGPLFYGLQLVARHLAEGETAARLMPAILGSLSVGLLTLAGTALGGRWVGLASGFLLAVSPLHVYYSREGRPYALVMFAGCLLLAACLRRPTRGSMTAIYAACLIGAYAGVFSGPLLASAGAVAAGLWLVQRLRDGARRGPRGSARHLLVAAVIGIAVLGMLYFQVKRYKPKLDQHRVAAVAGPLSPVALERAVSSLAVSGVEWATFEPRAWVFYGFALIGAVAVWRRSTESGIVVVGLTLLPILSALATLGYLAHWYSIRYTSSGLPGLLLLAAAGVVAFAAGIDSWLRRRVRRPWPSVLAATATLALLGVLIPGNIEAAAKEPYYKVDWRRAVEVLNRYGVDGETVVTSNHWTYLCLSFYLRDGPLDFELVNGAETLEKGRAAAEQAGSSWLATAGFHRRHELRDWVRSFPAIWETELERLGLYYYPDFRSFIEVRGARAGSLAREFVERRGSALEFDASESLFTGAGWALPELSADGTSFRWAQGLEAELAVARDHSGDSTITLRAVPLSYPDAPVQTLEVRLNGSPLETLSLGEGWQEYRVPAPQPVWRPGSNLLTLHFGRADAPKEVLPGASDPRPLAVAFDRLWVGPANEPGS